MVKCVDCGKEIPEDHELCCDICGTPFYEECGPPGYVLRVPKSGSQKWI